MTTIQLVVGIVLIGIFLFLCVAVTIKNLKRNP